MKIAVFTKEGPVRQVDSAREFEEAFGITYLDKLAFADMRAEEQALQKCARALRKEWIGPRQKWLGHYYAEGLAGKIPLDLSIRWIDDKLGYGVFTNVPIAAQQYIGEYTGILRKRCLFGRWQNLYCFDYNIGEGRRSRFVIDAEKAGNHTRFINHSKAPNLEPTAVYSGGLLHVIVYSKKAIPAGAQLCYDYGEDYWKKRTAPQDIET